MAYAALVSFRFETKSGRRWFRSVSIESSPWPFGFVSFRFDVFDGLPLGFRFVSRQRNTKVFMSLFRFQKKIGFDRYSSDFMGWTPDRKSKST